MIKAWVATRRIFQDNVWQPEFAVANASVPRLGIVDVSEQAVEVLQAIPVFMCEITLFDSDPYLNEETGEVVVDTRANPLDLQALDFGGNEFIPVPHSILLGWEEVIDGVETGVGNANVPVGADEIAGASLWLSQWGFPVDLSQIIYAGQDRYEAKIAIIAAFRGLSI